MSVQTRVIQRPKGPVRKGVPTVIPWKGVSMVASHSIRSVADELVNMSANSDFISINAIGKQSTGKTELMKTLSHLIHQRSKLEYKINYFGKKEMLNLEETVKNLTPDNQIIIMDDIAFLNAEATRNQIDKIQQVLSVIRHLPGGEDVKIILMKSFQYSKAIPPFLRQNDATFISSVDDNEIQNLVDLLGKKYHLKINLLKKLRVEAKIGEQGKGTFTYPLGVKGKSLKYKAYDPFLPYLYSNQLSCRIVVSPLRTWIDPICQVCQPIQADDETKMNLEAFHKDFESKFKEEASRKNGLRLVLKENGINTYHARINQAARYVRQVINNKAINLEELATAYDLKIVRTSLSSMRKPNLDPPEKPQGVTTRNNPPQDGKD